MIGSTVGNYRIVSKLGAGGMGAVFLAEHTHIGRKAAVKVLHGELCRNQEFVMRFFNEARATAQIQHPGLVDVFDFGYLPNGTAYLVMEYLEGESLTTVLRREAPLGAARVCDIGRQIAQALGAAHAKNIVHRDLKPDNVFLVPSAESPGVLRVKILDFGVAKLLAGQPGAMLTQAGMLIGTPSFMSPEQCKGLTTIDHRADIYALGCLLFTMACGRAPFRGDGPADLIPKHLYDPPPRPRKLLPSVPEALEAIILRCLAKLPGERFSSMTEVAAALEAVAAALGSAPRGPISANRQAVAPARGSVTPEPSDPSIEILAATGARPSGRPPAQPTLPIEDVSLVLEPDEVSTQKELPLSSRPTVLPAPPFRSPAPPPPPPPSPPPSMTAEVAAMDDNVPTLVDEEAPVDVFGLLYSPSPGGPAHTPLPGMKPAAPRPQDLVPDEVIEPSQIDTAPDQAPAKPKRITLRLPVLPEEASTLRGSSGEMRLSSPPTLVGGARSLGVPSLPSRGVLVAIVGGLLLLAGVTGVAMYLVMTGSGDGRAGRKDALMQAGPHDPDRQPQTETSRRADPPPDAQSGSLLAKADPTAADGGAARPGPQEPGSQSAKMDPTDNDADAAKQGEAKSHPGEAVPPSERKQAQGGAEGEDGARRDRQRRAKDSESSSQAKAAKGPFLVKVRTRPAGVKVFVRNDGRLDERGITPVTLTVESSRPLLVVLVHSDCTQEHVEISKVTRDMRIEKKLQCQAPSGIVTRSTAKPATSPMATMTSGTTKAAATPPSSAKKPAGTTKAGTTDNSGLRNPFDPKR